MQGNDHLEVLLIYNLKITIMAYEKQLECSKICWKTLWQICEDKQRHVFTLFIVSFMPVGKYYIF